METESTDLCLEPRQDVAAGCWVLCELPDSKGIKGNRMAYGIRTKPLPESSQQGFPLRLSCGGRVALLPESTLGNITVSLGYEQPGSS